MSGVPVDQAKGTNGKKDGEKGTDSGATGDGEGAATSNTNQWFRLPREFINAHVSPFLATFLNICQMWIQLDRNSLGYILV